jgi:hypothetical protein
MCTELYVPHLFGYSGCCEEQNARFSANERAFCFSKNTPCIFSLFTPVGGIMGNFFFICKISGF